MSYEDSKRRYTSTQQPAIQDGARKRGDDEFAFVKDPIDLQNSLVYRALAALSSDTAAADDGDLEFGAALDVEPYHTIAVTWAMRATSNVTETGILVPQVKLKRQVEATGQTGIEGLWTAPAVVDATLAAGLTENYQYRDVYAAEYRMAFQGPGGEVLGSRGPDLLLLFDVTAYAQIRFGVGVVTGETGVQIGLLTSVIR